MTERIKALRKALSLTQQEMADRIGIKRNTIANYETGRNAPVDSVLALICREFNVNEQWLKTGKGEMFIKLSKDEEIATFVGKTLSGESDNFKKRFISMLAHLNETEWEVLERMVEELKKD